MHGFCFDAPDGKPRIVMELCAHGSLRAHLQALPRDKVHKRGPMPFIATPTHLVAEVPRVRHPTWIVSDCRLWELPRCREYSLLLLVLLLLLSLLLSLLLLLLLWGWRVPRVRS